MTPSRPEIRLVNFIIITAIMITIEIKMMLMMMMFHLILTDSRQAGVDGRTMNLSKCATL